MEYLVSFYCKLIAPNECTVSMVVSVHEYCFSLFSVPAYALTLCWPLQVRLLTGIGRYNDMTYIFDLLNQNHRFEMLLRKKVESVRGAHMSLSHTHTNAETAHCVCVNTDRDRSSQNSFRWGLTEHPQRHNRPARQRDSLVETGNIYITGVVYMLFSENTML